MKTPIAPVAVRTEQPVVNNIEQNRNEIPQPPIKIVEIEPASSQAAIMETVTSNPLPQTEQPQNPTI
jgi:hypothetical protein